MKKVVLAYSGGLDTSVILRWLIETYGVEVIAYTADIGQGEEVAEAKEKAMATGATVAIAEDLSAEEVGEMLYRIAAACDRSGIDGESALRRYASRLVREIEAKG